MPKFRVDALEKFVVRTTYYVEAANEEEAEYLCKRGECEYDSHEIEEHDSEWVETVEVERA